MEFEIPCHLAHRVGEAALIAHLHRQPARASILSVQDKDAVVGHLAEVGAGDDLCRQSERTSLGGEALAILHLNREWFVPAPRSEEAAGEVGVALPNEAESNCRPQGPQRK